MCYRAIFILSINILSINSITFRLFLYWKFSRLISRLMNILDQIIVRGGLLGSLDASLHLYKTVYPSIGLLVHWSVCHASVNVFQQVKERESQEESHVVTSSHNHFIIMRTHRWPYGPCFCNDDSMKDILLPKATRTINLVKKNCRKENDIKMSYLYFFT